MGIYILADNQQLTSFAIESMLKQKADNTILRAVNKAELINMLRQNENAVVFLDYTLFDFADEDSLIVTSERFSMAQWILISDDLTARFLRKVLYSSHAFSVVFKDHPVKALRQAIDYASQGRRYICQRAMEMMLTQQQDEEKPSLLTATEIEILKAIAHGKTTKDIATERILSIHTINTHRKNIFRKLKVNTAHEAVRYALRAGWVDPSEFYI